MQLLPRLFSLGILLLRLFTESSAVEPARISTVRSYKLEFFEGGKEWKLAQKSCEERDSWLVEIEDEEMLNAVMQLKKHHIIWIGAYYNNGWAWNGSRPLRYENWKSRYPSTVSSTFNNYCGMMQEDGSWINIDCKKGYRYICQSDMTARQCTENVCSNRGTCKISNKRFICSCEPGYFGIKCEKDLITISADPQNVELKIEDNINVTLKTKSYGGNIVVSYKQNTNDSVNRNIIFSSVGSTITQQISLGVQLKNDTYYFHARPQSNPGKYVRNAALNVTVLGHCTSSSCMNGGTCGEALSDPYSSCACTLEYDGKMCEDRILIRADHPIYTTTQDRRTAISLRIISNHGPVRIEKYKDSILAEALETKRNITDSATFTVELMVNQTEGLSYIFKATPESDPGSYYKFTCVIVIVQDFISASPELNTEYDVSSNHLASGTNVTSSARDNTTSSLGHDTASQEIETPQGSTFQLSTLHVVIIGLGSLLLISFTANIIQALKLRNMRERCASKKEIVQGNDDRNVKRYESTFIGSTAHHFETADTKGRIKKESRTEKSTSSVGDQYLYVNAQCELDAKSPTYEVPCVSQVNTSSPYEEVRR